MAILMIFRGTNGVHKSVDTLGICFRHLAMAYMAPQNTQKI